MLFAWYNFCVCTYTDVATLHRPVCWEGSSSSRSRVDISPPDLPHYPRPSLHCCCGKTVRERGERWETDWRSCPGERYDPVLAARPAPAGGVKKAQSSPHTVLSSPVVVTTGLVSNIQHIQHPDMDSKLITSAATLLLLLCLVETGKLSLSWEGVSLANWSALLGGPSQPVSCSAHHLKIVQQRIFSIKYSLIFSRRHPLSNDVSSELGQAPVTACPSCKYRRKKPFP